LVSSTQHHLDFIAPPEADGQRLDVVIAKLIPDLSRSRLAAWIKSGEILLDGTIAAPRSKVWAGVAISVRATEQAQNEDISQEIALDVVYEDDEILVINKSPGLVVHPGAGNREGTVLNALLHIAPQVRDVPRAGIVHRLDKETSGLMVVAKTLEAQTSLVRQLQARTVHREYLALVHGYVQGPQMIEGDIGRHPTQRTKMAVVTYNGKEARTHVKPVEHFESHTLVVCKLETGRTHQIRVHLSHIGHPLVGDPQYGKRNGIPKFERQALHARGLALVHPKSGETLRWEAEIPDDLAELINSLHE
jgi:23S rRNA pseudouridine1911/1915/1917 synthase